MVAATPKRQLCVVRSERIEANRVRKGKAAIAVPSLDKLPSVIDTLITAVRNGELDEQLVQGSKVGMVKKAKAA